MKKKQLPLMIMTTLLLGIHSFATVEAAQVVGKWGTKPVVAKSSTAVSAKAPMKAVRGTIGKSTFKPLVTKRRQRLLHLRLLDLKLQQLQLLNLRLLHNQA